MGACRRAVSGGLSSGGQFNRAATGTAADPYGAAAQRPVMATVVEPCPLPVAGDGASVRRGLRPFK